jgi:hypothetical protein
MVFNATFNNISVISWRSVLLVEETGGPVLPYDHDHDGPFDVFRRLMKKKLAGTMM